MKQQMMTLSKFPLFLRFSVRMLCLTVFFIVTFINSQTPFSYSDSTIFISEDAYLYVESPVKISVAASLSAKNNSSLKQFNTIKRKAFLKLNSSATTKNQNNPSNQISFAIPKSSYYILNSNNTSSTAVLGNPFQLKQYQKMTDSAFWVLSQEIISEKKLLYHIINRFNLLKTITNYFSRPPPIFAFIMKSFINDQSSLMKLNTDSTNIYAQMTQMF